MGDDLNSWRTGIGLWQVRLCRVALQKPSSMVMPSLFLLMTTMLLLLAGDVEENPGPTQRNKGNFKKIHYYKVLCKLIGTLMDYDVTLMLFCVHRHYRGGTN